jgi:hypothetical protein
MKSRCCLGLQSQSWPFLYSAPMFGMAQLASSSEAAQNDRGHVPAFSRKPLHLAAAMVAGDARRPVAGAINPLPG